MEKFKELMSKCKCSVSITVNQHMDYYQSISDYIEYLALFENELGVGVLDKIIETDTIIEIQCYPDTPIGFYKVTHYDIDMAMDLMLEAVNNN